MNLEIMFKGWGKGRCYLVVDKDNNNKVMFRTFNEEEARQYVINNRK